MQQVVINVLEEIDVKSILDGELAAWKSGVTSTITDWSKTITDQIDQINAQIADIVEINTRQGKKINALSSRIAALEEAIANPDAPPGTYQDTY